MAGAAVAFLFLAATVIIIKFFQTQKLREIEKYQDPAFLKNLRKVDEFLEQIAHFNDYITWKKRDEILKKYQETSDFFRGKSKFYKKQPRVRQFNGLYENFAEFIKSYNQKYVAAQKQLNRDFFDNIEGKSLDDQQRQAIITDEYSNLIIAGAGSGKTLTILGKVKYLVEKRNIDPSKILLLSFTRKTVEELNQRLRNLGMKTKATTFHKLGYDYIKHFQKNPPAVANGNLLYQTIKQFLKNDILHHDSALKSFVQFMACYLNIPEENDAFDSLGEKLDIKNGIDFETLKSKYYANTSGSRRISKNKLDTFSGERVKSVEELMIANFLFLNGVNYEYEKPYPHGDHMYRPDFYLTDYDIWLEHFGIDKYGRAKWLSEFQEKQYLKSMHKKRAKHHLYRTKLLETYSWYNRDNILLDKLREMLEKSGVTFQPLSEHEIYHKIIKQDSSFGAEIISLITSFINLSKSRGLAAGRLRQFIKNSETNNKFLSARQNLFLDFTLPILEKYNSALSSRSEIDFNDMINWAAKLVQQKGIAKAYDYIIIDEYQDISAARFKLITEIRQRSGARLVCVGDDWQSIYRFTGSDISLFSDFGKFVGEHEKLFIERTYRNSQQLIDISAKFIQQNPQQLAKNPKSSKQLDCPVEFVVYDQNNAFAVLVEQIRQIVAECGVGQHILLLGRHSFDLDYVICLRDDKGKIIKNQLREEVKKYNETTGALILTGFEDVDIKFITVHKSKGLEADNVIVLNLKNDLYGFPNKLTGDPIISLLLSAPEACRFAEERRLFYVALTRTKNKVYLLTPENESLFTKEIKQYSNYLIQGRYGETDLVNCPWCKTGRLVIRKNSQTGKNFVGCSHYPNCNQSYNNIEILSKPILCPACQSGFLVRRHGRYGEFLGCTNYPDCKQILDLYKDLDVKNKI
jgi:helicase, uvrD/REP family protein